MVAVGSMAEADFTEAEAEDSCALRGSLLWNDCLLECDRHEGQHRGKQPRPVTDIGHCCCRHNAASEEADEEEKGTS
jgi:hypothetical protein